MMASLYSSYRSIRLLGFGLALALSLGSLKMARGDSVSLDLGTSTLTFQDSNPDIVTSIPANENPFTVGVNVSGNSSSWLLTVIASDDLFSGPYTIPASNISWTATGSRFQGGTMSASTFRAVGSGPKGSFTGKLSFFLLNSWYYEPGTYSTQITYTLLAP
jgi:hypothetical protein